MTAAVRQHTIAEHDPYHSRGSHAELAPRLDTMPVNQAGPLSAAQVADFTRNGFIELDAVFSSAELEFLLQEATGLRTNTAALQHETLILEPADKALRSVFFIHRQNAVFDRLSRDARLVNAARQLLGDEVYIHQSRLNYKPGFSGKEFYWHSDFETWHIEDGMPRMRALSMSIALTQNTEFNGPLMVMPGSHQWYVRCIGETPDEHYKQSLRKQEYGVPDPQSLQKLFTQGGIVAPKGPAGKVVIFDCNIMHGSNSNISPLPRSNVFLVYNSIGNQLVEPFGHIKPRPEFIAARRDIKSIHAAAGHLA